VKRLATRGFFYFRTGYGLYLSLPVALLGYASAIYYLALQNIPFFARLFPHFFQFIIFGIIALPFAGIALGWMHYKQKLFSLFFKAEQRVLIEANPYSMGLLTPVAIPQAKLLSQLGKLHGLDTSEVDALIEASEKHFGLKGNG